MSDSVVLTAEQLSLDVAHKSVSDPAAGAISTFSGTTRNNFNGKHVICLEYEAYEAMAVKEMKLLCAKGRQKHRSVIGIAMYHRLGTVPIGEASVIIAVSSPHRMEAIACCKFLIDELKATVPIWKKEKYEDGSVWKENAEFRMRPRKAIEEHVDSSSLT